MILDYNLNQIDGSNLMAIDSDVVQFEASIDMNTTGKDIIMMMMAIIITIIMISTVIKGADINFMVNADIIVIRV